MDQQNTHPFYIKTKHMAIIHDIAFDWHGTRFATCSSDRYFKIFKKSADNWIQQSEYKLQAPIFKIKWARPQFGIILATCSLDQYVKVYEQKKQNSWSQYKVFEGTYPEDIKFAPIEKYGLILASVSSDGYLRIFQSEASTINLNNWFTKNSTLINGRGLNCLTWNKNPFNPIMLAIGCKSNYKWLPLEQKPKPESTLMFYSFDEQWKQTKLTMQGAEETGEIRDISWAMLNGRSFHLLAVAGEFGCKVYKFVIDNRLILRALDVICDKPTLRASWNVMATLLCTNQPNKQIKIWKSTKQSWTCIKMIYCEDNPLNQK